MEKTNETKHTGTLKTGLVLSAIAFIILGISLMIYVSGAFLIPTLMAVLLVFAVATEIFSVAAFYLIVYYAIKYDLTSKENKKGIWLGFILAGGAFFANTITFLPLLITGQMI